MKPPEPLYPCHFCNEEFSWPASDLHWSNRFSDWVCGECWCGSCYDDDYEQDEIGVRLSDYLKDTTEQELATLRAKAEAYNDATEVWGIFKGGELTASGKTRNTAIASVQKSAGYRNPHFDMWPIMKGLGYTCRKVRIVEEVENV